MGNWRVKAEILEAVLSFPAIADGTWDWPPLSIQMGVGSLGKSTMLEFIPQYLEKRWHTTFTITD